jgi:hypothetical protein
VQSSFRGVIDGAKDIWYDSGYGADVKDESFGFDEERYEGLSDGNYSEEVRFEACARIIKIDIKSWQCTVATSVCSSQHSMHK